jgi:hypothetical protein
VKASKLIEKVAALIAEHGDLDVIISDGYMGYFYRGVPGNDYEVVLWRDKDNDDEELIDIGIGGCRD